MQRRSTSSWILAFLIGAVTAIGASTRALACSGPHASESMAQNTMLAWIFWAVGGVAVLAVVALSLLRHSLDWRRLRYVLGLMILHPAPWMRSTTGDCGQDRWLASALITAVIVVLAARHLWSHRRWDS